jgi:hypothetical protein
VFHVGQENVPNDGDGVDVEDAVAVRDQVEIHRLDRRPQHPVHLTTHFRTNDFSKSEISKKDVSKK